MRPLLVLISATVVVACASSPQEPPADVLAIQDYIEVAELPEVDRMHSNRDSGYEKLDNRRYVIFKARRHTYLVEFVRDCWELFDDTRITPDRRKDPQYLRPGMDTIRGCLIGRAFELNDGQVREIRNLGDAPSGG